MYRFHLGKIKNHKELKHIRMPSNVRDFGYEIAKFKGEHWILQRVTFWMYAYDRSHKWTTKDFTYDITDEAYDKAKEKRKERAISRKEYATKKHNKPRPLPKVESGWEEVSGEGHKKALKELGFDTMEEALFGKPKES